MKNKYSLQDEVIISKTLSKNGNWVDTTPTKAIIVNIQPTVTFGPAYILEVDGTRLHICYWESDIDGVFHEISKR